jgi:hypothetical protein
VCDPQKKRPLSPIKPELKQKRKSKNVFLFYSTTYATDGCPQLIELKIRNKMHTNLGTKRASNQKNER